MNKKTQQNSILAINQVDHLVENIVMNRDPAAQSLITHSELIQQIKYHHFSVKKKCV